MILDELNESQRKAAVYEGKHLLVLAGAGTGKTKTIIARAVYLISKGVSPSQIQILTFTRKAAGEIVSRVKASLPPNQANTIGGCTFHSWCNQLLTNFPNLFGTSSFTVIDEEDQVAIMKTICGKNKIEYESIRISPQDLIDIYSFARNTNSNLTDTIQKKVVEDHRLLTSTKEGLVNLKNKLEVFFRQYEEKKKERKYLDYDDIIKIVAVRFRSDNKVKSIISGHYKHILVDEFQDTNPLQWELLSPLKDSSSLYCVGDDAQSIYSFRGADFNNIHKFSLNVPGAEIFKLEDNYRSTQEILNLANWVLNKSPLNYDKTLIGVRGIGTKPRLINVESNWSEFYWIADQIINNLTERGKSYDDHLILSRSGFYTKPLQAVFIEKKIPHRIIGGRGFMEAAHIRDLVSALRVVNNKDDEIAWIRYLTFWEGIGNVKATSLLMTLLNLSDIEGCIKFLYDNTRLQYTSSVSKTLEVIFDSRYQVDKAIELAYDNLEKRFSEKYKNDWETKRRPDFEVLEILGSKYTALGHFIAECTIDSFSKYTANDTNQNIKDSDVSKPILDSNNLVTISTIHSAKGLESDICYVVDVSPKVYPHHRSVTNFDRVEEDRRLLYVALTRAKNELVLTRSLGFNYAENLKLNIPDGSHSSNDSLHLMMEGYFLNGLPENLVDQEVIQSETSLPNDVDEKNDLDIDYGMDFT